MNSISKFIIALLGAFIGIGMAILLGASLFYLRAERAVQVQAAMAALTPLPSSTPLFTLTPTIDIAAAEAKISSVFDQVEEALNSYDREKAEELLQPFFHLELNDTQKARFYGLLSMLERSKGHFRLACGYSENQYELDKTAANLNSTAQNCYVGGELVKAEALYSQLVDWPGIEGNPYRVEARKILDSIRLSLGTPKPAE
jgi:hypothetical protein